MNKENLNEEEFFDLLGKRIDAKLTASEHNQLEAALRNSREYRRTYRRMMRVHASLGWSRRWHPDEGSPTEPAEKKRHLANWYLRLGGLVAVLAASVLFIVTRTAPIEELAAPLPDVSSWSQTSQSLATISESVDVRWNQGLLLGVGDALEAGPLAIQSGLLQLDFASGARLILRGPADIDVLSEKSVRIRSGEATCYVGELGKGFQVLTGPSEVIDLGTEFGIRVAPNGESEVHVFEGEVSIRDQPSSEAETIRQSSAVRLSEGQMTSTEFSSKGFPMYEEIVAQHKETSKARYRAWKSYAKTISEDPATLVHYTFETQKANDVELVNRSNHPQRGSNGGIFRAKWTQGRWPQKQALAFREPLDRVLLKVPGEHSEFTFMIWVRADAFLQPSTVLLLAVNPKRWNIHGYIEQVELEKAILRPTTSLFDPARWMLLDDGQSTLRLDYVSSDRMASDAIIDRSTRKNVAEELLGKWTCFAVTLDSQGERLVCYRNGEPTSLKQLHRPILALLEYMELGNFSLSAQERAAGVSECRFFGAIDELVISNRAMSAKEIKDFYEIGRPLP